MKYRSRWDIGICIQGFMFRCEDELSTINAAMIAVEKLAYMGSLTKLLDYEI